MKENKDSGKVTREFGLSSFSVNNRTTVFVLTFIILIAGVLSYISMPKENFPEVITPEIYVGTPYPGNSPLDMEKLVTRPLEKEINTITGIDEINSTSVQGFSSIQVKFNFDVEPSEALRKVKDAVDIVKADPDFPKDLPADPNVFEMNFSELIPIMNVNLSGNYPVEQLREYAEYLEDKIENLPEISKVDIRGVQDQEMEIEVDLHKMEALEISFGDIQQAVQSENVIVAGGEILVDGLRRTVRVVGEFQSAEEIADVVVKREKGNIVHLREIAHVHFSGEERESYAREYSRPVVMLDVIKRAGENLLEVSDKINIVIAEAKENQFPDDLGISITVDQSSQTRTQVGELENSIIFGILLVVGVLLFFLGLRNALFVGVAIPLSMFLSFFILATMGVTLNVMVLFSLVLALGMLVDNGIVVVENIYRLMDEGYSSIAAAKLGVGEVAWPIIASTATTLAAFLPLAIWPGLMGEFMKFLPITLMIVLSSSLFVALVINPVLTSVFMKVEEAIPNKRKAFIIAGVFAVVGVLFLALVTWLGNLLILIGILVIVNMYLLSPGTKIFQGRVLPWMEQKYSSFLSSVLRGARPWLLIGGMILMLVGSGVLVYFFTPNVEFFPINQPRYLNIYIEQPIGTDIESTNVITEKIENEIIEHLRQYEDPATNENYLVESVIAQVGEGTSDPNEGVSLGSTPHKGRITVGFVDFQYRRGAMTSDVMDDVRELVRGNPGVQVTVDKDPAGPPQKKPINIEVKGDDYNLLIAEAEKIRQFINAANIPGIEELQLDVEQGKPELPLYIDREKARRYNLSTYQIGDVLRTALYGKEVATFKDAEDDYPINIRLADKFRYDSEVLLNQKITFRDQMTGVIRQVPISAVSTTEKSSTFSAVKRKDLDRIITVSSNVLEGSNANEIVEKIQGSMESYEMPEGYTYKFTGQQEEQAKEMAFLSTALMIAVGLIFLIIVAQFNSTSTPVIIVTAVIFSLIGVLLGLVIFQMDFIIIMTMIGIIALAGVVVNNAIVLIDYTNLVRERKRAELGLGDKDRLPVAEITRSVVEAGKKRLRPVLLTAITTILGLLPLATGMNINFYTLFSEYDANIYFGGDNVIFWGPMSWTIIFGLTFATFLTLVVVPVMYFQLAKFKYRVKNWMGIAG